MTILAIDQGTSGTSGREAIVGSDDGAVLGIGEHPNRPLVDNHQFG